MESSQSSKFASDPLSEVLSRLKLGSARCTRLEAGGDWALHFPGYRRLKFVAILRGQCRIEIAGNGVYELHSGHAFLLTDVAYTASSGPGVIARDGTELYALSDIVRLGGDSTIMLGGGFTFDGPSASFFGQALPSFMMIDADKPGAATLSAILRLLESEMERTDIGQSFLMQRLADILLVEGLRAYVAAQGEAAVGWLGALSHPQVGRAIALMHANLNRRWRVDTLASSVGMSRSGFALKFKAMTGIAPQDYLRRWRMWVAQTALEAGSVSVGRLAADMGYASESAFGAAFKSVTGKSPRQVRRRQN